MELRKAALFVSCICIEQLKVIHGKNSAQKRFPRRPRFGATSSPARSCLCLRGAAMRHIVTMGWHTVMEFTPSLVGCVISSGNHSFRLERRMRHQSADDGADRCRGPHRQHHRSGRLRWGQHSRTRSWRTLLFSPTSRVTVRPPAQFGFFASRAPQVCPCLPTSPHARDGSCVSASSLDCERP